MDTGLAEVISSVVSAIASIIVAIVAGYYAIRSAETKTKLATDTKTLSKPDERRISGSLKSRKSRKNVIWRTLFYAVLIAIVSGFLGFFLAYVGNVLYAEAHDFIFYDPFMDSVDPALVGGFLGFMVFIIGKKLAQYKNIQKERLSLLFLIVAVFSAPISFSLAYLGNWLESGSGGSHFWDSLDSLFVGSFISTVTFGIGIFIGGKE